MKKAAVFVLLAALLAAPPVFAAEGGKKTQQTQKSKKPQKKAGRSAQGKTYTNSIGMEFVRIPAGSFMMGCESRYVACKGGGNIPRVTITRSFYMGKYEVTQAQWEAIMGSNPSQHVGAKRPVDMVSWEDAQTFILRLNRREGAKRYRLPTEAEWEYASRAGSTTFYHFGGEIPRAEQRSKLAPYAWCAEGAGNPTHPVGQKRPNSWGLYDMYGNVQEWVWDRYSTYPVGEVQDPTGSLDEGNEKRVLRGGAVGMDSNYCNSVSRDNDYPASTQPRYLRYGGGYGFRLVYVPEQEGGESASRGQESMYGADYSAAYEDWVEGAEARRQQEAATMAVLGAAADAVENYVADAVESYHALGPCKQKCLADESNCLARCEGLPNNDGGPGIIFGIGGEPDSRYKCQAHCWNERYACERRCE